MSTEAPTPAVELRGASLTVEGREVLAGVDLQLQAGQTAVIAGGSGSGKSTLLCVCAGLVVPTAGHVLLGGFDTAYWPNDVLFQKGVRVGIVFQEGGLLNNLTVLANVAMPLQYHRRALGLKRLEFQDRARAALERVGVDRAQWDSLPAHVGRGTRRRVAVARLVALEPGFVFLDDPCAGLEPADAGDVADQVREIVARPDVTAMLVSTNPGLSCPTGGVHYRLSQGALQRLEPSEDRP